MVCFLGLIYYKVGYDFRETAAPDPDTAYKLAVTFQCNPGLILIFCEISVLAALECCDFDPRADGREYGHLLHDLCRRPPDVAAGRAERAKDWKWCSSWRG